MTQQDNTKARHLLESLPSVHGWCRTRETERLCSSWWTREQSAVLCFKEYQCSTSFSTEKPKETKDNSDTENSRSRRPWDLEGAAAVAPNYHRAELSSPAAARKLKEKWWWELFCVFSREKNDTRQEHLQVNGRAFCLSLQYKPIRFLHHQYSQLLTTWGFLLV